MPAAARLDDHFHVGCCCCSSSSCRPSPKATSKKCGRSAFSQRWPSINFECEDENGAALHLPFPAQVWNAREQQVAGGSGTSSDAERFWLLKLLRHHFSYPWQRLRAKQATDNCRAGLQWTAYRQQTNATKSLAKSNITNWRATGSAPGESMSKPFA